MISLVLLTSLLWVILAQPPRTDPDNQLLASVTTDEQRAWIKIECVAGTAPSQIASRLNTILGRQAFSESHILRLCREFTVGGRVQSVCFFHGGSARTATSDENVARLLAFIVNNDGGRVEEIASELQVSESSVLRMLNELGYRFVKGKWVPHDLSDSQRQKRVETAQNNLRLLNDNPRLLDEIIAIDETWLPNYLPLTDPQAGQWVGPGEEA